MILVQRKGFINLMIQMLADLIQLAKNKKQNANDGEEARHWAVVYTELEKIAAYLKTYLTPEE